MAVLSTQVDDRYTPELIAEINFVLESKGGSLTKWNQIIKKLLSHKIAYKRIVKISEVMVHPKNRGGLGLNAHNVHRTLAIIVSVGADKEQESNRF